MKWISVDEKLPSVDNCVLVYAEGTTFVGEICRGEWLVTSFTFFDDSNCETDYYQYQSHVTHWMPLPEPPVDKNMLDTSDLSYTKDYEHSYAVYDVDYNILFKGSDEECANYINKHDSVATRIISSYSFAKG